MEVTTRPIREEELPLIIEYFNEEEWNVSIKSVRALYRYQPEAFNVAVTPEGKVVGMFCKIFIITALAKLLGHFAVLLCFI